MPQLLRFFADDAVGHEHPASYTAMFGAQGASQCGLDFFGAGHSLFATDCPYDEEGGARLIRDTIAVLEALRCTDTERAAMFEGNAKQMLGLG